MRNPRPLASPLSTFAALAPWTLAALHLALASPGAALPRPWIGLTSVGAQLLFEEPMDPYGPGADDRFGFALAVGDFNADGADDLVTGIPFDDCDPTSKRDCGLVSVKLGTVGCGLSCRGAFVLDPSAPGAPQPSRAFSTYGAAVAAGDFDGDGHDDLAVGEPAIGQQRPDSTVDIYYGQPDSDGALQRTAQQMLSVAPFFDTDIVVELGRVLATGDFDGDGRDDLAVGAPSYLLSTSPSVNCGAVFVFRGTETGLLPFGFLRLVQGHFGLPDTADNGDWFGSALAAGDFNGDSFDDLAIGAFGEDGGVGAVMVVYGSASSLDFGTAAYFGMFALGSQVQFEGHFGAALAAGDFDGNGFDDLAVGAPDFDGTNGVPADMGLIAAIYGSPWGLALEPERVHWIWEDLIYGVGESEAGDRFGATLAAGDFDGDGLDDLAVGAPLENLVPINVGAVTILPGRPSPFGVLSGVVRRLSARPGATVPWPGMIPDVQSDEVAYGSALAIGDFDGNQRDDLAIGAPLRSNGAAARAGGAAVVYASAALFRDDFEALDLLDWSSVAP